MILTKNMVQNNKKVLYYSVLFPAERKRKSEESCRLSFNEWKRGSFCRFSKLSVLPEDPLAPDSWRDYQEPFFIYDFFIRTLQKDPISLFELKYPPLPPSPPIFRSELWVQPSALTPTDPTELMHNVKFSGIMNFPVNCLETLQLIMLKNGPGFL